MQSSRAVVFLGAPGSGKGTQSSLLASQLGVPCFSTGDLLRSEARANTPDAFRLRQLLASGALVADELVCSAVAARLRRRDSQSGVILDGFPRTVEQAQFLDAVLDDMGWARPIVMHLDVSAEGLLKRLGGRRQCAACGAVYNLHSRQSLRGSRCELDGGALVERDDDRREIILRRFEEFARSSAPLIRYYAKAEYVRVNGDRPVNLVAEELLAVAHGAVLAAA